MIFACWLGKSGLGACRKTSSDAATKKEGIVLVAGTFIGKRVAGYRRRRDKEKIMRNLQQWVGRSLVLVTALAMATITVGCGSDSEDDTAVATDGGEAAEEGGEAAEEGGEGPADGCPEMDLTGSWDVQFVVSLKPEPTTVWMNIEQSGDDNCYTGDVIAPSDNSDLAVVSSVKISGGKLVLQFDDFNIPPGQTALLPDGGTAAVTLTAGSWDGGSMCGDIVYNLVEPFATEDTGTFAAVETCSGWTISEEGAATCDGLTEGDVPAECGEEEEGGEEEGGETAEEGGEAAEEGGEAAEEGGEAAEEGGEAAEEGGEAVEEGGEAVEEEGGEAATAVTWSELETALQADCAPCHFGGYAAPFNKTYAMDNTQYMITRIENGTMPPSGVVSPDLVGLIQGWEDGGFQD